MNTWQPQQPVRPESQNHVALGVLIALAVVGAALALLTALDRRDSDETRDTRTLAAAVDELHDARIELQASASELRGATATLQEAARTLERRATTVNILDVMQPPAPPAPREFPAPSFTTPAVDCADEGRCTISRIELEHLFDDPSSLARQARIMPSVRDGKTRGFKMYGVRPGSLPKAIGFKNGDLIVSVNDRALTSIEVALAAVGTLRTAKSIKFAVQRKDEPVTLTLEVE